MMRLFLSIIKIGALTVLATIKMRRGDTSVIPLLEEAKEKAFKTYELQRTLPVMTAYLEYEWITGNKLVTEDDLDKTISMINEAQRMLSKCNFFYWLSKTRMQYLLAKQKNKTNKISIVTETLEDAGVWQKLGCPYEQALALFEGDDEDKRKAISIIHTLGGNAVYEKLKLDMRSSGIKSIPRGIRKTTQSNPALLTGRELDVLSLLQEGIQNKEIAARLYISAKTVDHHISSILFKLDTNSRTKAVTEAIRLGILK